MRDQNWKLYSAILNREEPANDSDEPFPESSLRYGSWDKHVDVGCPYDKMLQRTACGFARSLEGARWKSIRTVPIVID